MRQGNLFEPPKPAQLPGFDYCDDFVSPEEEGVLLSHVRALPLEHSKYRQYTARRRTLAYGAGYDFQYQRKTPAPALPPFLAQVRARAAQWIGVAPQEFVQALVTEYQPGTALGWHRDVPDYETVVAISLGSACRMRLRRYPWNPLEKGDIVTVELQPRSVYVLSGAARWRWQHSLPPVKELRYSITFRTARHRGDESKNVRVAQ